MAPQQRRSFQGDGSAEIEVVTHGFGTGIRELVNLKFLPNEQLPLDTPLWRYMKLSTFFLLLRDKAFIPRLQKLQEGDPQEGRILTETPYREEFLKSDEFMSAWDWLKAKHDSRLFVLNQLHGDHGPQLLKEWRYQLSTRRCAWCWFCPTKDSQSFHVESMAMWNLYARDGVAVSTTLAAVKSAIQEPELDELLVANAHYAECDAGMEHVKRPFLFKSGSYAHEKEVRIVFRVIAARDISGLKVNVEPNALLKGGEVVISPFVAPDEADAIIEVARGLLKEPAIRFRQSEEWRTSPNLSRELVDELVRAVGPFSKEEDLPALLQKL